PTNPTLAGSYDTLDGAWKVVVAGDHAFVADGETGLHRIDISDPTNPMLAGSYNTSGDAQGVALAGDFAFVTDRSSGLQVIQVRQGKVEPDNNTGQSVAVDEGTDTVLRARLTSTETSGVSWELSADAGGNWQSINSDNTWNEISISGDDLRWRSTHTWSPGLNPTVSELTLDWLYESGPIASIADVPDDQGGRLYVDIVRSGYDFADETTSPVTQYGVYRRVDNIPRGAESRSTAGNAKGAGADAAPLPGVDSYWHAGTRYVSSSGGLAERGSAGAFPSGTWALVATVPATQSDAYLVEATTVADSTESGGIDWSVYVVTTHTTVPSIWFTSQPDSGYSVDNIAPAVPQNLVADYQADGVDLDWDDASEADFQYHRVYRGSNAGFIPEPGNLIRETASSAWTDPTNNPWGYYYKVTTLDHAGNESEAAEVQGVSGVGDNVVPTKTALLSAYPNPFNPSTKLSFELATPARVRLNIFDAAGRLVTTLVDEQRGVGRHDFVWNGQNDAGRSVASGVYLYRFEAGDVVQTKRMMLLK
ncbi:MAG: T9SS type A sorting domain-containing protein, partial [bacterium]|nr:T9SS type A sorting domain-containing protein [bacterium]